MSQYTYEQRAAIRVRIVALRNQNLTWNQVLNQLTTEGFKAPSGLPLTSEGVYQQWLAATNKKKKYVPAKAEKTEVLSLTREELRLIANSNLTEQIKNKLVRSFV